MTPIQRILATTDGSITAILEAITGEKVSVETVEQKVIEANGEIAGLLKVNEGDKINYRVVNLRAGDVLAHAVSYTPIKRLRPEFREDLMKADMPIGKIMRKHRIEARREINWWKIEKAGELGKIFGIDGEDKLLVRNYSIIHRGEILINITEYFSLSKLYELT